MINLLEFYIQNSSLSKVDIVWVTPNVGNNGKVLLYMNHMIVTMEVVLIIYFIPKLALRAYNILFFILVFIFLNMILQCSEKKKKKKYIIINIFDELKYY
jgi:MFS superfamily sulfate permease-like transporter